MEEKALQPIVINGKTLMEADGKFTADGIELIRKTVAIGATDLELQMLLYLAQAYKLDPFLKEIIFIKRKVWNDYKKAYNEVPSYLVPRDGHLAIAHRGGQFDGMETVALHDKEKGTLMGAKCTVYNKSMAHPITVSVLFSEYCVKGKDGKAQALWATKPETMIKKVAEAQALRKAFNIKGMYIPEEMEAEAIKDAAGEIEHMAESIKTAEAIHSTKVNYDEWATDTITHILESLETCKTEQDVWRVEKAYAEDIKTMVDKDREYVLAMIDSAKEECIRGDRDEIPTAEAVAKVNNELEAG